MPHSTHQNPERKRGESSETPAAVARAYRPVHVRRWSPNLTAAVLVTLLTLLLPACVRTADTHEPIVNASVQVDSFALGPSLQFGDVIDELLGRRGGLSSSGTTDQLGIARMEHVPGRTLRVAVLGTGGDIPCLTIEQDVDTRVTDWLSAMGAPSGRCRVQVRAGTPTNFTLPMFLPEPTSH
jgi:hypothetical protein